MVSVPHGTNLSGEAPKLSSSGYLLVLQRTQDHFPTIPILWSDPSFTPVPGMLSHLMIFMVTRNVVVHLHEFRQNKH